jgi:hypothetical protein
MEFTSESGTTNLAGNCNNDEDYPIHRTSDPTSHTTSRRRSSTSTRKTRISSQYDESSVITTTTISPSITISNSPVYHVEHRYETYCRTHIDIVELIKQWQLGHISNFDYLLILNALSGRKFHDPNNHLIFPWINDFTSSTCHLRDLSQTKYRLNKGDFLFILFFFTLF